MRASLLLAAFLLTACGKNVRDETLAATDENRIGQALRLPADEQLTFMAAIDEGNQAFLASHPTVRQVVQEGSQVPLRKLQKAQQVLDQSRATELALKKCAGLKAAAYEACHKAAFPPTD